MKGKKLLGLAVLSILVLALPVLAYRDMKYEGMQGMLEDGSYNKLVQLRQESGAGMPFVHSEAEFKEMQEMHEAMKEYHKESGFMGHCFQ